MLRSRQIDKSTIDTFSVNLYENAISLYIRTNLRLIIQLQREVQHVDVNLPKIYKKVTFNLESASFESPVYFNILQNKNADYLGYFSPSL